jgi:hypothetical protein
MHTLRYDDPDDPDIQWLIHYNSDYSGMAQIVKFNKNVKAPIETCEAPCKLFINWIGYKIQGDVIKGIKNMSGEDFLKKIVRF